MELVEDIWRDAGVDVGVGKVFPKLVRTRHVVRALQTGAGLLLADDDLEGPASRPCDTENTFRVRHARQD